MPVRGPKYFCYTCGKPVEILQTIYGYNPNTGAPLVHSWRECSNKRKWYQIWREWYHPVTPDEGIPYYLGY